MTDERRVEVAAEALHLNYCREARCVGPEPDDYNAARAVVAALDAHDGDLRERLAGAVEAAARADAGAPWVGGLHIAVRLIREVEL